MAFEEGIADLEGAETLMLEASGTLQQGAPALGADEEADVVANDCRSRRECDHNDDVEPPGGCGERCGDERRFARERHAERLEHDE